MDDFLYGSTRIRAMENRLIGKEKIERLSEAGSIERCMTLLSEFGFTFEKDPETGKILREETLTARLRRAYEEVRELTEDAPFLRLWLYPYDCQNIKAAIKAVFRGIDCRDMTFDFGTVPVEEMIGVAEKNDFSRLPEPFGSAAREAADAFAKTKNPQWIDLILDRASFAAMSREAKACGVEYAAELVTRKIDLVNLMTCVRLLRMRMGEAGKTLLANAYLEGGELTLGYLSELYAGGEDFFWEKLAFSAYSGFAFPDGSAQSLTRIECAADNEWMRSVRLAALIPYGAEPLIGYLIGCEYEVRNLRIILAGYEAGIPVNTLKERIRISYV